MATLLLGRRFLNSIRFKTIVMELASALERERPLTFIDRLTVTPAFEDEITGRFTGNVIAADIIADDQEAVVQEVGKVEFVTNAIPNLKIGQRLGQAKINVMNRLLQGTGGQMEENSLADWENQLAENLVYGVRQRMNALACAMMMDALTYNRMGIQITGATWGMPAGHKVTPAIAWSTANAATMVPITNIMAINNAAMQTVGMRFDRMTISSTALDLMIGSTQFSNRASLYVSPSFQASAASIGVEDREAMKNLVGRILNMDVVLEDGIYYEKTNAGSKTTHRYMPENKVILDIKANDRDGRVWDWANGVVTESIVDEVVNGDGGLGGGEYGPIGYYTGREDLNPPDVVAWAVARGFPRKHVPEASAVLTVF